VRLPGRLSAAMVVLADLEARRRPASESLKDWGNSNRFAGAGDRAAIGNLVYDALRRRASHAWRMGADTPRALVLAVAVHDWGETPEAINAAGEGDRFAPEPITPEEAERAQAPDRLENAPDWVRADVPEWTSASLQRAFGADWVAQARGFTDRPPLDLRVNRLKSSRDKVCKALSRFEPQDAPIAPDGVRMPAGARDSRTPNVQADEGYIKGWFEVQDAGSQLVSVLAGAEPGQQVLDLCAGAGGKTLAMAAGMNNRGQIFAFDSERPRLAPIYDRLKRNGVRNAQVRPPDPGALDDLTGRMDLVLVDAPCTGTGTWRRRPDSKWKLGADQLALRVQQQAGILKEASTFVKPGGSLVYITCSVLPEENDEQVTLFLAAHVDFALVDGGQLWSRHFPDHADAALVTPMHGLMLTPLQTGTDGFYCARFVRSA